MNGTKNAFFPFASSNSSRFYFTLVILIWAEAQGSSSETVHGIFHFRFCFVFIKVYIFVQQNALTLWLKSFIIPFKIKIIF